jgi:transcription elongation factor Elf1
MPIFNLECPSCNRSKKVLRKIESEIKDITCKCGAKMQRKSQPLSTKTTEIIDNGLMAKKVEVLSNIEEAVETRKQKHRDRFKL